MGKFAADWGELRGAGGVLLLPPCYGWVCFFCSFKFVVFTLIVGFVGFWGDPPHPAWRCLLGWKVRPCPCPSPIGMGTECQGGCCERGGGANWGGKE